MQTKNIRYILIFCLALLVFNWPVLSIAGSGATHLFFLYLLSAWLFIILLIFVNGLTRPDIRNEPAGDSGLSGSGSLSENSASSPGCGKSIAGQEDSADHV